MTFSLASLFLLACCNITDAIYYIQFPGCLLVKRIFICSVLRHFCRRQIHCNRVWWQEGDALWGDLLRRMWLFEVWSSVQHFGRWIDKVVWSKYDGETCVVWETVNLVDHHTQTKWLCSTKINWLHTSKCWPVPNCVFALYKYILKKKIWLFLLCMFVVRFVWISLYFIGQWWFKSEHGTMEFVYW